MNNLVSLNLSWCSIELDIFTMLPPSLIRLYVNPCYLQQKQNEQNEIWSFSTPNLKFLQICGFSKFEEIFDLSKLKELPLNLSELKFKSVKLNSELVMPTSIQQLYIDATLLPTHQSAVLHNLESLTFTSSYYFISLVNIIEIQSNSETFKICVFFPLRQILRFY